MDNDRHLFKAKCYDDSEWIYGNYAYIENKHCIIGNIDHKIAPTYTMFEVIPETVCQCTGLKDKNRKLIFENDLVIDNVGRIWIVEYDSSIMSFIFKWQKDTNQFQTFQRFNKVQKPLEITGNIHDEVK